jgi:hypothetical protein
VSQPVFVFVQTNRVGHVLSPNALSLVQRDGNRSGVWNTRLDDLPLSLDRDSGFSRTMFEFNLLVLQLLNAAFWLAWLVEAHGLIWLQRRNSARSRQLLLGGFDHHGVFYCHLHWAPEWRISTTQTLDANMYWHQH